MTNFIGSGILELLPSNLRSTPEVQALSYAIQQADIRREERMKAAMITTGIDNLPEAIVDERATELKVPYYDTELDLSTKRTLVKDAFITRMHAGTKQSVQDLLSNIFGEGKVIEWFEYGGAPYTFRIETEGPMTSDSMELFSKMIEKVKNARSKLESITFIRELNQKLYAGIATSPGVSAKIGNNMDIDDPERVLYIGMNALLEGSEEGVDETHANQATNISENLDQKICMIITMNPGNSYKLTESGESEGEDLTAEVKCGTIMEFEENVTLQDAGSYETKLTAEAYAVAVITNNQKIEIK